VIISQSFTEVVAISIKQLRAILGNYCQLAFLGNSAGQFWAARNSGLLSTISGQYLLKMFPIIYPLLKKTKEFYQKNPFL
jgi:hypothetical protein